jgi:hypothetical protein
MLGDTRMIDQIVKGPVTLGQLLQQLGKIHYIQEQNLRLLMEDLELLVEMALL